LRQLIRKCGLTLVLVVAGTEINVDYLPITCTGVSSW